MRVPTSLVDAFGADFEKRICEFAVREKLLPEAAALQSPRFLARSVVPHIAKLSSLFNRVEKDQSSGLEPYWKESSNPAHLRLAYFLYFMPCNLFRVAAIWSELSRLGYRWNSPTFKAIEFGAGPASGLCGIAAGEKYAPIGLPSSTNWALIEQDRGILELGNLWAQDYLSFLDLPNWDIRPFHRKLDPREGFLPKNAPQFNLWLMSFYLNETQLSSRELAGILIASWAKHMDNEGLIILVEPALKLQSRRLLELRQEILLEIEKKKIDWLQVLLPCLGHQKCGAFANEEDWCHEEVSWWRPPYFRQIDKMAELDRKTLPFSYLVLAKSRRKREEILPALAAAPSEERHRLVSPAHSQGKELEFFLCGQEGKRKARFRPSGKKDPHRDLGRGDILMKTEVRGDLNSSRVTFKDYT